MSSIGGRKNFGLFKNGDFSDGVNNFSFGTYNTSDQYSGKGCLQYVGGGYGTAFSDDFIEIDVNKYYQMICYVRTLKKSTAGNLAGGHIGFACFDKNKDFIGLEQCGGIANTYLTRQLDVGDSYMYVSNINQSQWFNVNGAWYLKFILIYPPTHPDYGQPYKLTRIGAGNYNIFYDEITDIGGGELRFRLCDNENNPIRFPNIGYPTPINTPICNGVGGSNYNYALNNPDYPLTWTRFSTPVFTGEGRTETYPFRWGTKYIKFLILLNYNHGGDNPQDCIWALDNIFFGEVNGGRDYPQTRV